MARRPLPVLVTVTLCGKLALERLVGSKFTWVRWIPACVGPNQRIRLLKLSAVSIAPESPSKLTPRGAFISPAAAGPLSNGGRLSGFGGNPSLGSGGVTPFARPGLPVPASVDTAPVAGSTRRSELLRKSATTSVL